VASQEAIAQASEDAQRKAQTLASSMGIKLGKILNISTNAQARPRVFYANSFAQIAAEGGADASAPRAMPVLPNDVSLSAAERLARLAETMLAGPHPEKFALMNAHHNSRESKFGHMRERPPLLETFRSIRTEGLWVKMTSVDEADPEYADLLQRIIEETETLSGLPLRRQIEWSALTILLDSPLIALQYHMDHEFNLLLQVQGIKEVHLFDGTDRSILSEHEIEGFI